MKARSIGTNFLLMVIAIAAIGTVACFFKLVLDYRGLSSDNTESAILVSLERGSQDLRDQIARPGVSAVEFGPTIESLMTEISRFNSLPLADDGARELQKSFRDKLTELRGRLSDAKRRLDSRADVSVVTAGMQSANSTAAELRDEVQRYRPLAIDPTEGVSSVLSFAFLTIAGLLITGIAMLAYFMVQRRVLRRSRTIGKMMTTEFNPANIPESMQREQAIVKQVAASSPVGVVVHDTTGKLLYCNDRYLSIFKTTREKLEQNGRPNLADFVVEDFATGVPVADEQRPGFAALRAGTVTHGRELVVSGGGLSGPIAVAVSAVPLRSDGGGGTGGGDRIDGVMMFYADLTERTAGQGAYEAELEGKARATRAEIVGSLATGIAHDMGNSLLAIDGAADAVGFAAQNGQPLTKPFGQLKGAIGVARESVSSLVNLAAGKSDARSATDLDQLIPSAHSLATKILLPGIRATLSRTGSPMFALVSQSQIQQVLLNLYLNSRDAMPNGGNLDVKLAQEASASGAMAVLTVTDSGTGMPESVRRRVFEKFFTTKGGKGTGIGLAQVQEIVESHGGTTTISSTPAGGPGHGPNAGTTVTIRLPMIAAPVGGLPVVSAVVSPVLSQNMPPALPSAGAYYSPPRVAPVTAVPPALPASSAPMSAVAMVIISDDNARAFAVQSLRNAGLVVEAFRDGESALASFKVGPENWDVVVIDLSVVGLDGVSTLRRMRRIKPTQAAVFLAEDSDEATADMQEAGTTILLKPTSGAALRQAVANVMGATGR